jgi:ABC-2 type transport system permease protein
MTAFLRRCWAFVVRDFRAETSYRFAFAMQLGGLLWMLVAFRFVAALVGPGVPALQRYGGNFFTFVLLGYAPLEYLRVGIMGFSRSVREAQAFGTLEALLVTRAGIPTIIFGSVLYDYARATLRAVLFIAVASAASGQLRALDIPAALAFLALSIPCFAALGILSASFVMVFKKGDPISLLFLGTSTLLGGLLFPTEMLGRFQAVSRWLPLTYAMEGVRQAAEGHSLGHLGSQLLPLAAFSVALVPLAAWSFRAALDRARRDGTLSHY